MLALTPAGALIPVNEPASAILSVQLRSPMAKLTQINAIIRPLLTISLPAGVCVPRPKSCGGEP